MLLSRGRQSGSEISRTVRCNNFVGTWAPAHQKCSVMCGFRPTTRVVAVHSCEVWVSLYISIRPTPWVRFDFTTSRSTRLGELQQVEQCYQNITHDSADETAELIGDEFVCCMIVDLAWLDLLCRSAVPICCADLLCQQSLYIYIYQKIAQSIASCIICSGLGDASQEENWRKLNPQKLAMASEFASTANIHTSQANHRFRSTSTLKVTALRAADVWFKHDLVMVIFCNVESQQGNIQSVSWCFSQDTCSAYYTRSIATSCQIHITTKERYAATSQLQ